MGEPDGEQNKPFVLGMKQYHLYGSRDVRVTATVEQYEEGSVKLTVEASKAYQPSLREIEERAGYQILRMNRWREADEQSE